MCRTHRLELGILDAMKEERLLKDVKETLQGLYKHYHYSSKALRELREVAEALELAVLNVMGTRWVSHLSRAVKTLLRNMKHIVLHLQHTQGARSSSTEMMGRAKIISRQLKIFKKIMFMHSLLDVLDECSFLSLTFQKDSTTLTTVTTALERVELGLSAMLARPAKHLKEFFETCVTTGDSNVFKEMDLQGDRELEIAAFSSVKSRVIEKVLHFSSRFSSLSTHAVLKAGIIFDHKTWPDDVKELATFGEEALRTLLQHFQTPLINKGKCTSSST